jgi:hypothetical protein
MSFYIRIYMRTFIWTNHLGLLLRQIINVVFVSYKKIKNKNKAFVWSKAISDGMV